jgi:hypothetical protein
MGRVIIVERAARPLEPVYRFAWSSSSDQSLGNIRGIWRVHPALVHCGDIFINVTLYVGKKREPMGSSDSVLMRARFTTRRAMRDIIHTTLDNTADGTAGIALEKC